MADPIEMKHPVPPGLLVHIGDIVVSFAMLESQIQSFIGSLINEHQRVGQIITAELSFKNLRALAISLYIERHGEDGDFDTLKALMKRADEAEQLRNQINHSLWATGDAGKITRIKATAKEKRGMHFHFEQMGDAELGGIALKVRLLAAEITQFEMHLLQQGKVVNTPIKKMWGTATD